MIKPQSARHLKFSTQCLVLAMAVVVGCSKKQETSTPTAPAAAATPDAPGAAAAPAEAAQTEASGPIMDTANAGDAKAAIAEADAALRQKEYEKAVRTLLAVQQAQLNAQQAAAARQAMIALQRNISAAAASGDQRAIAAGEALRAASRH